MSHSETNAQTVQLNEKMLKAMECPVCLMLPRQAPVYQCENGHCVCSSCKTNLAQCPTCRKALGCENRNRIFEELLMSMTHVCKFANHGCTFSENIAPLAIHEQDCQYRVVSCPYFGCKLLVSMAKLLEHIKTDHKEKDFVKHSAPAGRCLAAVKASFNKYTWWLPSHINLGSRNFFSQCWRTKKGQWFICVRMIGSKNECENYTYTVRLYAKGEEKKGLTYCGSCLPLDLTQGDVEELGNCLNFSDKIAKQYLVNEAIMVKVTID